MRKPPPHFGTRKVGLAYGDLINRTTSCSNNSFTIFLKMASLGGPHLYGGERIGVGSGNSISYVAQTASQKTDENNLGNSAMMEHEHTPIGQTSDMVTRFNAYSHKFCKKGTLSPVGLQSTKAPTQNYTFSPRHPPTFSSALENPNRESPGKSPLQYYKIVVPRK
jgi:hypothetical protein